MKSSAVVEALTVRLRTRARDVVWDQATRGGVRHEVVAHVADLVVALQEHAKGVVDPEDVFRDEVVQEAEIAAELASVSVDVEEGWTLVQEVLERREDDPFRRMDPKVKR